MPEYDNTNRIILFSNDKGDNPDRPDLNGKLNIEGKEYKFSLWKKQGQKTTFYAGPVEPADQVFDEAREAVKQTPPPNDELEDTAPF